MLGPVQTNATFLGQQHATILKRLNKRFLSVLFDIPRQSIVVENFYLKIAGIDIAQSTI